MPNQTLYIGQAFERQGRRLTAGRQLPFPSAEAAIARAERAAQRFDARTVGFVAVQQVIDTDTGEVVEEPLVLARFGELPPEFGDG